mgnify:CR=1 FL=1
MDAMAGAFNAEASPGPALPVDANGQPIQTTGDVLGQTMDADGTQGSIWAGYAPRGRKGR